MIKNTSVIALQFLFGGGASIKWHPHAVESYAYIEDLVELERRRPAGRADIPREVCMPLVKDEWARCMKSHPDNLFRSYIVEGIQHGFRIGFQYAKCCCKRARKCRKLSGIFKCRKFSGIFKSVGNFPAF